MCSVLVRNERLVGSCIRWARVPGGEAAGSEDPKKLAGQHHQQAHPPLGATDLTSGRVNIEKESCPPTLPVGVLIYTPA